MLRPLFFFLLLGFYLPGFTQGSDFLSVRRRNGRVLKTFIAGTPIAFETKGGSYIQGPIKDIRNDSLFIFHYTTAHYPTRLGTMVTDTVSRQVLGYHYKEISSVTLTRKHRFIRDGLDRMLMLGGASYLGLNLVNGAYLDEPITSDQNLQRLGIGLGVFGLGFGLNKLFKAERENFKNQKIVYVRVR
ncbi:hypothetical protein V9K67_09900 [Paraflavisolibacter sp. H34]|uniref:hypothetical protein n=1 Tax=Huijunlia imazamoxiresistens TaxID=3127457 RepID=UPI0030177CB6